MNNEQDPCKKFACQLQYCLQANNYNEIKCKQILLQLIKCCQTSYSTTKKVSDTCSGFIK